jgi:hypothetical protein
MGGQLGVSLDCRCLDLSQEINEPASVRVCLFQHCHVGTPVKYGKLGTTDASVKRPSTHQWHLVVITDRDERGHADS